MGTKEDRGAQLLSQSLDCFDGDVSVFLSRVVTLLEAKKGGQALDIVTSLLDHLLSDHENTGVDGNEPNKGTLKLLSSRELSRALHSTSKPPGKRRAKGDHRVKASPRPPRSKTVTQGRLIRPSTEGRKRRRPSIGGGGGGGHLSSSPSPMKGAHPPARAKTSQKLFTPSPPRTSRSVMYGVTAGDISPSPSPLNATTGTTVTTATPLRVSIPPPLLQAGSTLTSLGDTSPRSARRNPISRLSNLLAHLYTCVDRMSVMRCIRHHVKHVFSQDVKATLYLSEGKHLVSKYVQHAPEILIPSSQGLLGAIFSGKLKAVNLSRQGALEHPSFDPTVDAIGVPLKKLDGVVMVPIVFHKHRYGVLVLLSVDQADKKAESAGRINTEVAMLRAVAKHCAIVLSNISEARETSTLVHEIRSLLYVTDENTAVRQMLEFAKRLVHSHTAMLWLLDRHKGSLFTMKDFCHGLPGEKLPFDERGLFYVPCDKTNPMGWAAVTRESLVMDHPYDDERYDPTLDLRFGIRTESLISIPLLDQKRKAFAVIQVSLLDTKTKRKFSNHNRRDLELFGLASSVTITNARIIADAALSTARVQTLLNVAKLLGTETETTSMIRVMMQEARLLLNSDKCTVFVVDSETGELWSKVVGEASEIRFPKTAGLAGHVVTTGQTLNIKDAYEDPRFNQAIDKKFGYRTKTILCMPIKDSMGKAIGCVQAVNKLGGDYFNEGDENMLQGFTSQAALALQSSIKSAELVQLRKLANMAVQTTTKNSVNIVLDPRGIITTVSAHFSDYFGARTEAVNRSYVDWLNGLNEDLEIRIKRAYRFRSNFVINNFIFNTRSGEQLICCLLAAPEKGPDKRVQCLHITFEDVRFQRPPLFILSNPSDAVFGGGVNPGKKTRVVLLSLAISNARGRKSAAIRSNLFTLIAANNGQIHEISAIQNGTRFIVVFGIDNPTQLDSVNSIDVALQISESMNTISFSLSTMGSMLNVVGGGGGSSPVRRRTVGFTAGCCVAYIDKKQKGHYHSYEVQSSDIKRVNDLEKYCRMYGAHIITDNSILSELKSHDYILRELDTIVPSRSSDTHQPYTLEYCLQVAYSIYDVVGKKSKAMLESPIFKSLPLYSEALAAFRNRKWLDAITFFGAVVDKSEDVAARLMKERCDFIQKMISSSKGTSFRKEWKGHWCWEESCRDAVLKSFLVLEVEEDFDGIGTNMGEEDDDRSTVYSEDDLEFLGGSDGESLGEV